MSKHSFLSHASQCTYGRFRGRRSTWVAVGTGVLVLVGVLIWSALALFVWFWGQTQNLAETSPGVMRGAARAVLAQVSEIIPGARSVLDQLTDSVPAGRAAFDKITEGIPGASQLPGEIVPTIKPETPAQNDVPGQDFGPVRRFPGIARTQWQRKGGRETVEYEGKVDYVKVLDYYAAGLTLAGFSSAGFAQTTPSSTLEAETHKYTRNQERITLTIAQKPKGRVSVRIEANLP